MDRDRKFNVAAFEFGTGIADGAIGALKEDEAKLDVVRGLMSGAAVALAQMGGPDAVEHMHRLVMAQFEKDPPIQREWTN